MNKNQAFIDTRPPGVSEMQERLAIAMAPIPWQGQPVDIRNFWRDKAQRALIEMKIPTERMLDAGHALRAGTASSNFNVHSRGNLGARYTAMIEDALS